MRGLTVELGDPSERVRVLDDVTFEVHAGHTLALVGESGSGKTLLLHALMRLLPERDVRVGGRALLEGRDLFTLDEASMCKVRGGDMGLVFQEPATSLNPVQSVGAQIIEAITLHRRVSRRDARARAIELLRRVDMPDPDKHVDAYPHELSGGMRQRVLVAIALANDPKVVLADEPTSALDTVTQAHVIGLLERARREHGATLVLVLHDLVLARSIADEVVVLYAGQVIERGPAERVLGREQGPRHPYTELLLACTIEPGARAHRQRGTPRAFALRTIGGAMPDLRALPPGCRFAPRCPYAEARCDEGPVALTPCGEGHEVRCVRVEAAGDEAR